MVGVEQSLAEQAVSITDINTQLSQLVLGLTKAAETATKNTESCRALSVTSERLLKNHEVVLNKVSTIETHVEGLVTRVASLEGTISTVLQSPPSPNGHRVDHEIQGNANRHALGNGASLLPHNIGETSTARDMHLNRDRCTRDHHEFRMPKTNFPKFDGSHPKLWKEKAEKYFHMFNVPEEYKVDYATLHFLGSAALWLQTYEAQHSVDSWVQLCVAVCRKFAKDLYYTDMSKTLNIRQTGDVDSYQKEFETLMHQLLAHNHALDDTFFVAKFIKGLKKEIRSAIVLHKPRTVDAAISLALLQESQLQDSKKLRYEYKPWHNQAGAGRLGPHPVEAVVDAVKPNAPIMAGKIDNLRAQRRARGECFKCGGKYGPGHKCPEQVQLAVVNEICAALELDTVGSSGEEDSSSSESGDSEKEQAMSISLAAAEGTVSKKTMRLLGNIAKSQVLILIDSGSSGNFINSQLVTKLQLPVHQLPAVQVTIADGSKMCSNEGITSLNWGVQGAKFSTDVRVLPITCYDLILGMEWLASCNGGKMFVDWNRKKMRFMHAGHRITLRGLSANNNYCPKISEAVVHQLIQQGAVAQLVTLQPARTEDTQVQWTGLPDTWTTCENKHRLQLEFPDATAWGQAETQDGGNVTTFSSGP